jgi:hypothetical protein
MIFHLAGDARVPPAIGHLLWKRDPSCPGIDTDVSPGGESARVDPRQRELLFPTIMTPTIMMVEDSPGHCYSVSVVLVYSQRAERVGSGRGGLLPVLVLFGVAGCWDSSNQHHSDDTDSQTLTDSDTVTETETESETDTETETETDTETETETEPRFVTFAIGGYHGCALDEEGKVFCWGASYIVDQDPPDDAFVALGAGYTYTCGIKDSGEVICWGPVSWGIEDVPDANFLQVSVGYKHACGVTEPDNSVVCWGDDSYGQSQAPPGPFSQVSAGAFNTCGVRSSGEVACWGDDSDGQSTPPIGSFLSVETNEFDQWIGIGYSSFTCGIKSDTSIQCWGSDDHGQASPPAGSFSLVSVGSCVSWALDAEGVVGYWGEQACPNYCEPPEWICWEEPSDTHYIHWESGCYFACGLTGDGAIDCFGFCDDIWCNPIWTE